MTQQCGNCKWWDTMGYVTSEGKRLCTEWCRLPESNNVEDSTAGYKNRNEGQDCPVYEERKE